MFKKIKSFISREWYIYNLKRYTANSIKNSTDSFFIASEIFFRDVVIDVLRNENLVQPITSVNEQEVISGNGLSILDAINNKEFLDQALLSEDFAKKYFKPITVNNCIIAEYTKEDFMKDTYH